MAIDATNVLAFASGVIAALLALAAYAVVRVGADSERGLEDFGDAE